jgi:hypothetical protein
MLRKSLKLLFLDLIAVVLLIGSIGFEFMSVGMFLKAKAAGSWPTREGEVYYSGLLSRICGCEPGI